MPRTKGGSMMTALLTVNDLLAEKQRMEDVIEAGKAAKLAIPHLNYLIALQETTVNGNGKGHVESVELTVPCPQCGKLMGNQLGVTMHVARMHKAKAEFNPKHGYPCSKCDSSFATTQGYGAHVRKIHGIRGGWSGKQRATK